MQTCGREVFTTKTSPTLSLKRYSWASHFSISLRSPQSFALVDGDTAPLHSDMAGDLHSQVTWIIQQCSDAAKMPRFQATATIATGWDTSTDFLIPEHHSIESGIIPGSTKNLF